MRATEPPPDGTDGIDHSRMAYTVKETARLLSLSVRKVRYMVATGELVSIKVGHARRVHGGSIEAYVREHIAPGSRSA